MLNRKRTQEVLGYDFDPNKRRRTQVEINAQPDTKKKSDLKVVDNCPGCNIERIIQYRQSKKNKMCYQCLHNQAHVLEAKQNQKKDISEKTKQKMRDNHWSKTGNYSPEGRTLSKEARDNVSLAITEWNKKYRKEVGEKEYSIRRSCSARRISRNEFDGFTSDKSAQIRASDEYKEWERQVKLKFNNRCVLTGEYTNSMSVHHLNSFALFPDKRFDVNNGVLIHRELHHMFHNLYGRHGNTADQFELFKKDLLVRPIVYLIAGVAGSGKSWVCRQLAAQGHNYVSYDNTAKNHHVHYIFKKYKMNNKPVLYDRFTHVSTFIRCFSSIMDIRLIVICDDKDTFIKNISKRGGSVSESWHSRFNRMRSLARTAHFSGTSQEVLDFLMRYVLV